MRWLRWSTPSARRERPGLLWREIGIVLLVKGALLYGLWLAFFSEPAVPRMSEGLDPGRVAAALVASPPSP